MDVLAILLIWIIARIWWDPECAAKWWAQFTAALARDEGEREG